VVPIGEDGQPLATLTPAGTPVDAHTAIAAGGPPEPSDAARAAAILV
jgi:hypothetical protein